MGDIAEYAEAPHLTGGYMTKLRNALILAAASALLCLPTSAAADTTVKAKLVEVNGSGVSGTATLTALGRRWSQGGHPVRKARCRACSTPSTSTGQGTAGTSGAPR